MRQLNLLDSIEAMGPVEQQAFLTANPNVDITVLRQVAADNPRSTYQDGVADRFTETTDEGQAVIADAQEQLAYFTTEQVGTRIGIGMTKLGEDISTDPNPEPALMELTLGIQQMRNDPSLLPGDVANVERLLYLETRRLLGDPMTAAETQELNGLRVT